MIYNRRRRFYSFFAWAFLPLALLLLIPLGCQNADEDGETQPEPAGSEATPDESEEPSDAGDGSSDPLAPAVDETPDPVETVDLEIPTFNLPPAIEVEGMESMPELFTVPDVEIETEPATSEPPPSETVGEIELPGMPAPDLPPAPSLPDAIGVSPVIDPVDTLFPVPEVAPAVATEPAPINETPEEDDAEETPVIEPRTPIAPDELPPPREEIEVPTSALPPELAPNDPPAAAEEALSSEPLSPLPGMDAPLVEEEPTEDYPPETLIEGPIEEPTEETEPIDDSPKSGKDADSDYDPIEENGPIFVDWPDPSLALVITGSAHGYLEPCGCAGLDRMKGGMSRRIALFEDLEERGWPTLGVDAGGLVKSFGRQAELKFRTMLLGLKHMDYKAIALGGAELRFPATELLSSTADMPGNPSPFISSNVAVFGFAMKKTAQFRVVEKGGWVVGITSVLAKSESDKLNNPDLEIADPSEQIRAVQAQMLQHDPKCDVLILMVQGEPDEAKALLEEFPRFSVGIVSTGRYEPPMQPKIVGRTPMIEVGEKGMHAVVLGLYRYPDRDPAEGPEEELRYQRVPLDSRFKAGQYSADLMQDYQAQLKRIGFERLGLRPVPHPLAKTNGNFVGSKECRTCHEPSYDVWKKTGHSDAWKTLQEATPTRIYDPECVSCHAIGWHPTEYFPYEDGYWSEETTPHLVDVGCESCHGPGELHVKAETARNDDAAMERLRQAMVVTLEESEKDQCETCHDLDNSPDFDFKTYWPKIVHKESLEDE